MVMNFIKNPNDYFKNLNGVKVAANSNCTITDSEVNSNITDNQNGFKPGSKGLNFSTPVKHSESNEQSKIDTLLYLKYPSKINSNQVTIESTIKRLIDNKQYMTANRR